MIRNRFLAVNAAMLLVFVSSSYAQDGPNTDEPGAETSSCDFNFSSGGGPAALNWCVSTHGNIVHFESPAGFEHVGSADNHFEGYVVCSGTTRLNFDVGSVGQGWQASHTVLTGPSATGITLRRISEDGDWQLDQQFKSDKIENDVTITMTLTNLGAPVSDVRIARSVHFTTDNDFGDDWLDRTDRSVTSREVHGIALTNTTWNQTATAAVAGAAAACSPASQDTPTTTSLFSNVTARLGNMGTGKTVRTKFVYRRQ